MSMLEQIDKLYDRDPLRSKVVEVVKAIENKLENNRLSSPVFAVENLVSGAINIFGEKQGLHIILDESDHEIHGQVMARIFFGSDENQEDTIDAPMMPFPIMDVDIDNFATWSNLYNAFDCEYIFDIVRSLIEFSKQ